MTINISDNALKDALKEVFNAGYRSPMEEKDGVLNSILSALKEKQPQVTKTADPMACESEKKATR